MKSGAHFVCPRLQTEQENLDMLIQCCSISDYWVVFLPNLQTCGECYRPDDMAHGLCWHAGPGPCSVGFNMQGQVVPEDWSHITHPARESERLSTTTLVGNINQTDTCCSPNYFMIYMSHSFQVLSKCSATQWHQQPCLWAAVTVAWEDGGITARRAIVFWKLLTITTN